MCIPIGFRKLIDGNCLKFLLGEFRVLNSTLWNFGLIKEENSGFRIYENNGFMFLFHYLDKPPTNCGNLESYEEIYLASTL